MNLHIVPDNTFINAFYDNLKELGLLGGNRLVVRTNGKNLVSVKRDLPFAPLYSERFENFVGDTGEYKKVFIHYFTPLLYKWVARHQFNELNWMVWGGDLYNLPGIDALCYEPITLNKYIKRDRSLATLLYKLKVYMIHDSFKTAAYGKVSNILTWMREEHQFALSHLPVKAGHKFFFYENQSPYAALDAFRKPIQGKEKIRLIIGNSGTPANNHLDVVEFLNQQGVQADLIIPVSYGDKRYISFLKKHLTFGHGSLQFIEEYMSFEDYVEVLSGADALVMNTVRPQGYGNILMMLYLDKPVFFNEKNSSLAELREAGINYRYIRELPALKKGTLVENKNRVAALLSHDRLLATYRQQFSDLNSPLT
jgi:hypothetical protein